MEKRRNPDWSELPPELLELIVTKLHFMDVLRLKGVCSSFRLAAKVRSSAAPLLMHQSTTYHRDDDEFFQKFGKTVRFLDPHDMNSVIYSQEGKKCLGRLLNKGCCIGSSHGWLVVLDKKANPFLLNPFSGAEIELPKKETIPAIIDGGYRNISVCYDGCVPKMACLLRSPNRVDAMYVPAIQRAILTANPSHADDYKVFIICNHKLAFCCCGDRAWRHLSSSKFRDLAFHNGRLYALQNDMDPLSVKICTWDISLTSEIPQECERIVVSDFLNQVYKVDLSWDYRTFGFEIYKLEGEQRKEFVRVESLPFL